MKGQSGSNFKTEFPVDRDSEIFQHELGNALNGLFGMAELLGASGLNPEQQRWIRAIRGASRQLQALAEAFNPGVAPNVTGVAAIPEFVDGIDLLEQVVTSHFPSAYSHQNDLCLKLDSSLCRYWRCDPCLLRQVLDNLLCNAVKFNRSGSIVLEAVAGDCAREGATLIIRVIDNGRPIGIREAEKIFLPGHRGRHADGCQGFGLGLFVCRRIVESMDGRIRWRRTAGPGNCFELSLPETLLAVQSAESGPRFAVLENLHCRLDVPQPYQASIGSFLDRLGITWCEAMRELQNPDDVAGTIHIAGPTAWRDRGAVPALEACLPGHRDCARSLGAPFLLSTLGPVLLELALEWVNRGGKQDSGRPRLAAGLPDVRGRRPA